MRENERVRTSVPDTEPAAMAQFYDHETEADLPKWLIAFNNPANTEVYRTKKEWLQTVLIEKGCKFNIGPLTTIK
jgi:hypothetical protein